MLVRLEDKSPLLCNPACLGPLELQMLELLHSAFVWALGMGTQVLLRLVQQEHYTH